MAMVANTTKATVAVRIWEWMGEVRFWEVAENIFFIRPTKNLKRKVLLEGWTLVAVAAMDNFGGGCSDQDLEKSCGCQNFKVSLIGQNLGAVVSRFAGWTRGSATRRHGRRQGKF